MLLDRRHGDGSAKFLEVSRDESRADVGEFERLAFAPGEEAIDGLLVGGAGVVVGDRAVKKSRKCQAACSPASRMRAGTGRVPVAAGALGERGMRSRLMA